MFDVEQKFRAAQFPPACCHFSPLFGPNTALNNMCYQASHPYETPFKKFTSVPSEILLLGVLNSWFLMRFNFFP
jgi:hypothetical protein